MPFAGGISRTDMDERTSDTDAVDKPFYIGCTSGRPAYIDKTVFVPTDLQSL